MKKIVALVLALCLLLFSASAMADVALGAPFTANVANFRVYFDTFYSTLGTGAEVTWTEGEGTLTVSAPGIQEAVLYLDAEGKVMFISISFAGGQTEFLTASEPLGVSVSLTAMSMLMAETNDAEALQKYAATVEADMTQIFSCMLNAESLTEEQMQEGVASTGTLMGYPACLGYRVDMSEESGFQYEVEYVLAPQGTTF